MRGSLSVLFLFVFLSLAIPGQAQQEKCGNADDSDACSSRGAKTPQVVAKFHPGDIIKNYTAIRDPARYGLSPYGTYYKSDGYVYLVERESKRVLDLVGAAAALMQ